jgi:hypothetical protein
MATTGSSPARFLFSPIYSEFLSVLSHFPIILPISERGMERRLYFLLSIPFISHKSFRKNFRESNLALSLFKAVIFCSFDV